MTIMANSPASIAPALRAIPSVDQLLRTEAVAQLQSSVGMPRLTSIARQVTEEMRKRIQSQGPSENSKDALLNEAVERIQSLCRDEALSVLRRVINATGVILHT